MNKSFERNYQKMLDALIDISEYWNRDDETWAAMVNACYHDSELATRTIEDLEPLESINIVSQSNQNCKNCKNCTSYIKGTEQNNIFGFNKPDGCKKLGIFNQGEDFYCAKFTLNTDSMMI